MEISSHKCDEIQNDFMVLKPKKQDEALVQAFINVPNCLPATKDVYLYIIKKFNEGKDDFSIPAMLIPAMLGMGYTTSDDMKNFKNRFIKQLGKEGDDWIIKKKSDLFSIMVIDDHIEFPVPGRENESIIIRKDAGNSAKWPFITPKFARFLLVQTTKPISRQLVEFYFQVHDSARRLKQEIDAGNVALTVISDKISELEPEFHRAIRRLEGCEDTKESMGNTHTYMREERASMVIGTKVSKSGVSKKKYNNHIVGAVFAKLNGKINKALTGQTRGDFARSVNCEPVSSLNFQNFWDEELLSNRRSILKRFDRIVREKKIDNHREILELMDHILEPYIEMRGTYGNGKLQEDKMGKIEAQEAIVEYNNYKKQKTVLLKNK